MYKIASCRERSELLSLCLTFHHHSETFVLVALGLQVLPAERGGIEEGGVVPDYWDPYGIVRVHHLYCVVKATSRLEDARVHILVLKRRRFC